MKILCMFFPHKWIHIMNIEGIGGFFSTGLYQCRRCKEISKGSPRQFVSAEDRKKRYEKGICDDIVDGCVIPDPKKLLKMRKKLDKQLSKISSKKP